MNKIEKYFINANKREKYLIYFMVFGLIFYVFIQIMIPIKENIDTLHARVNELQVRLSNNSLAKLKKLKDLRKKELFSLIAKKDKQKEDINHLISGLYKLKYAFYDEKEWAKSIDEILKYSLVRNLKIDYLKSFGAKQDTSRDLLKQKGSLEISGSGNYSDIVAFISYIDNLNTLLQFEKTGIKIVDGKLKFKLNINMYGIGL